MIFLDVIPVRNIVPWYDRVGRNHSEYKKDVKGHFNTSNEVIHQGNISNLPGNFKNPVYSLGRNRLNDIRWQGQKYNP